MPILPIDSILRDTATFTKTYDKLIYLLLIDNNKRSIKDIAALAICSQNAARQSIKRLKEQGLIDVSERKLENGTYKSNIYTINYDPFFKEES